MKRNLGLGLWSLVCLGIGVWIGTSSSRSSQANSSSAIPDFGHAVPAPVQPVTPSTAPAIIEDEGRSLTLYVDPPVKKLVELNQFLREKISVPLLTSNNVNEDFVKLYDLSPEQVQQIKELASATTAKLGELEAAHAEISRKGENEFVISVAPFPTEGGQLYNSTLNELQQVLGDDRYALYQAMNGRDLESSAFRNFGVGELVINLKSIEDANGRPSKFASLSFEPGTNYTRSRMDTDPSFFETDYPALYRKMVRDGLWKYPPAR